MLHHAPVFKKRLRGSLFQIGLLASLCASVATFYTGSFAESLGMDEFTIAALFAVSSLVSIAAFVYLPASIARFGSKKTLLATASAYTLGTLFVGTATSFATFIVPFTCVSASFGCMLSLLDMYVEHSTDPSHREGEVRGLYLALQNLAYIVGPFVGGLVLTVGGFTALFWASALFMIPVLGIIYEHIHDEPIPHKHSQHSHIHHAGLSWEYLVSLWKQPALRSIYLFYFLLRMFFALMGIYTAVFLASVHHMSVAAIGTIIAISLIPMVAVEMPVGKLLDSSWHHGRVGMTGFGIMAVCCALVPAMPSSEFWVWALLLLAMRIGTSLVEIVAETYFFALAGADSKKAGVFRATYPVSYIVAPPCGALALASVGYSGLFLFLAFLSLIGAYIAHDFHTVVAAHMHTPHSNA